MSSLGISLEGLMNLKQYLIVENRTSTVHGSGIVRRNRDNSINLKPDEAEPIRSS